MIGDPQVLQPRSCAASAISASVAPPSLQSVWQWNVPVRSPSSTRSGSLPASAASISPLILAQLGRDLGQPERLEHVGLGPARDRTARRPTAHTR